MTQPFGQYQLLVGSDGTTITVDVLNDLVLLDQAGRGAAQLAPNEAQEVARHLQDAAQAARSFTPPAVAAAPVVSSSPVVQALLDQLGPAGIEALAAALAQRKAEAAAPAVEVVRVGPQGGAPVDPTAG